MSFVIKSQRNCNTILCVCVCVGGGLYTNHGTLSPPIIVQELCESRGGRPELSVLTSLLVSVDVKNY